MELSGDMIHLVRLEAVFLEGVVCCGYYHRAQGDDLRAGDDADFLALGGAGQPSPKILAGSGDRDSFHVLKMTFKCVRSQGLSNPAPTKKRPVERFYDINPASFEPNPTGQLFRPALR